MRHYTSLEQSKKLIELGLDFESADMHYNVLTPSIPVCGKPFLFMGQDLEIPCWSVGALFGIMPFIKLSDPETECLPLLSRSVTGKYACFYENNDEEQSYLADTPIDAAFQMVVWLLNNGLIKNVRPSQAAHPT